MLNFWHSSSANNRKKNVVTDSLCACLEFVICSLFIFIFHVVSEERVDPGRLLAFPNQCQVRSVIELDLSALTRDSRWPLEQRDVQTYTCGLFRVPYPF